MQHSFMEKDRTDILCKPVVLSPYVRSALMCVEPLCVLGPYVRWALFGLSPYVCWALMCVEPLCVIIFK
jgi:hypothetical protein